MGKLADKIGKAFESRKHRTIEVPEWGETIHVFPLTLGQLSRINEEADPMRRLVRVVLVRARNEKGELMFDTSDADALFDQGVDGFGPVVTTRIVRQMGDMDETLDEAAAEKN